MLNWQEILRLDRRFQMG